MEWGGEGQGAAPTNPGRPACLSAHEELQGQWVKSVPSHGHRWQTRRWHWWLPSSALWSHPAPGASELFLPGSMRSVRRWTALGSGLPGSQETCWAGSRQQAWAHLTTIPQLHHRHEDVQVSCSTPGLAPKSCQHPASCPCVSRRRGSLCRWHVLASLSSSRSTPRPAEGLADREAQ